MRTSPRWIVPIAVVGVIAGGVTVSSAQAGSAPSVPERTPQQVLAQLAGSHVDAFSGTVVTRADLGLPSVAVPGGPHGGTSAGDLQGLLTRFLSGKNTLRVWSDGPTRHRVQLLDSLDEFDVVRDGSQFWTYSAAHNEVGKATLPADAAHARSERTPSGPADLTPDQMARRAVEAADPTTAVTLGTPELVAGRATYALTLTPKTDKTLVDRIVIAVDAVKSVPLQVEVFARGHRTPAIQTGFTSVSFSRPAAETFRFTPPKGSKVTDLGDGSAARHSGSSDSSSGSDSKAGGSSGKAGGRSTADEPTISGTGWATIVEFPGGRDVRSSDAGDDDETAGDSTAMLEQLTRPVAGGRAMSSRLLSVY